MERDRDLEVEDAVERGVVGAESGALRCPLAGEGVADGVRPSRPGSGADQLLPRLAPADGPHSHRDAAERAA